MGVVFRGYRWRTTADGLATIRRIVALAAAGQADSLSDEARRMARRRPPVSTLAAFGLADPHYVDAWIAPAHVHPALAALLLLMPELEPLGRRQSSDLANRRGVPVRSKDASAVEGLPPLGMFLKQRFGPTAFDDRPLPTELGRWDEQPPFGEWLVSTAIW